MLANPARADHGGVSQTAASNDVRPAAVPRVVLDRLPAHVRADLERAYDAVAARPRDPDAVGRLAMLLHAFEQYRAASDCYELVRRLEPTSLDWIYLGGVVHAEVGDRAVAVEAFRRVLERDPDQVAARLRLAEALMRLGDLDRSQARYAALTRDYPELALAHYGLGRLATIRRNARAALPHYEQAVALAPEFGPAHYALALAYRDAGLADRAQPHLEAYRRLGTRRPAIPDPLLDRVRALRETARDLLAEAARLADAGQLDASIALHLKALKLDPATAQAHVNLISLYGRTGAADQARAHYEAALALGGSLADAHYNYGVLLGSERRLPEAEEVFRKALAVDPFHPAAHNNLASLLARAGKYEEAAAHYRQTLANDPQHPSARLNLGRVLGLLGRREEAAAVLQQALDRAERAGDLKLAAAIRRALQGVAGKR